MKQNEENKKVTYYSWLDGFDGGEVGDKFDTAKEAKAAMVEHCANIRLTWYEYEKIVKECGAFVQVYSFNEDDEIIEEIGSISISPKNSTIYSRNGYVLCED